MWTMEDTLLYIMELWRLASLAAASIYIWEQLEE